MVWSPKRHNRELLSDMDVHHNIDVSGCQIKVNRCLDCTTVAKITWVSTRRSIDVIHEVIAAISYFDVNGPRTAVKPGEADLSYDLTLCQSRMSTV